MNAKVFKSRIRKIHQSLKKESSEAALLISSAPSKTKSYDTDYPYTQDKDFFYLTGSNEPDLLLLISNTSRTPLLFAPLSDKRKILWEGPQYDLKLAVANSGAELIEYKNAANSVYEKLRGIETLYYQNTENSLGSKIARGIFDTPAHKRSKLPSKFQHSDNILGPMRLHKEVAEVKLIQHAIEITYSSWCMALPLVMKGTKEDLLAATIEYGFRSQDADYGFQSIVASGKNASVLHYHRMQSCLKEKDLLLFDIGASFQGYSADISRTVPVSKSFNEWQLPLYELVLKAQKAAIKKIRHGVLIKVVHEAAALVIIEGLVKLKLLKGKPQKLLKEKAHLPFFPHGIGHSLGLDVHDIGNHRGNNQAKLEKGMVFTVEPGIYLPKKYGKFPACGIRIEDDVLVTANGCHVLSDFIPKEPEDIEELMHSV